MPPIFKIRTQYVTAILCLLYIWTPLQCHKLQYIRSFLLCSKRTHWKDKFAEKIWWWLLINLFAIFSILCLYSLVFFWSSLPCYFLYLLIRFSVFDCECIKLLSPHYSIGHRLYTSQVFFPCRTSLIFHG